MVVRPVIGVTTYSEDAHWDDWTENAALLPRVYVDAVRAVGGLPVLLPPGGDDAEAADAVAAVDGVIVAGGPDVEAIRYGAMPHPRAGAPDRERDAWELALIDAAVRGGVPLLGVCRGMQLLNVAYGGTLIQHVPDVVAEDSHGGSVGGFGTHPIRIGGGSLLHRILGTGAAEEVRFDVPTHHHQAVDRIGDGLVAIAWTADGIVEAVEPAAYEPASEEGDGFILGVQWHPEAGTDMRLFAALIAVARQSVDLSAA